MPPSDFLPLVNEFIGVISFGVALVIIYRSLALRRILVDRPYRSRALWMGIGGLSVGSFISAIFISNLATQGSGILENGVVAFLVAGTLWGFTTTALFGWIWSNINVAISTDFFHRDSVLWLKGGRLAAAVSLALGYVLDISTFVWPSSGGTDLRVLVATTLFAGATVYAGLVLAVTFVRIHDRGVRNYIQWVAFTMIGLLLLTFSDFVGFVGGIVMAVSMYKAVGALSIRTRKTDAA